MRWFIFLAFVLAGFSGFVQAAYAWDLNKIGANEINAVLTIIDDSPDMYDEPNLIGINPFEGNLNPSVLETIYGEVNLLRIDDSRDIYFRHTGAQATAKMVAKFSSDAGRFGFTGNDGLFQPVLWAARNDYIGYFPELREPELLNGVIEPSQSGNVFALRDGHVASSLPQDNYLEFDLMVTFEIVGTIGHPENSVGSFVVGFEDNPRKDRDYQDLVIEIAGLNQFPSRRRYGWCWWES